MVGGEPAGERFPECCAVGRTDVAGWFGSGVLISPDKVLTAGHNCFPYCTVASHVALPTTDVCGNLEGVLRAIRGTPKPHFGYKGRNTPFDVGLVNLRTAIDGVLPAQIATTDQLQASSHVTLVGFGVNDSGVAGIKRIAQVPIQFLEGRVKQDIGNLAFDREVEFVAGTPATGACYSDSGGPAYIVVAGEFKLAGIIAGGKPGCGGFTICTRIDIVATFLDRAEPFKH